jgi:hypothetical protein
MRITFRPLQLFFGLFTASSLLIATQPYAPPKGKPASFNLGGGEYLEMKGSSNRRVSISESQDTQANRFCLFEMDAGKSLRLNLSSLRSDILQLNTERKRERKQRTGKSFGVLNNGVAFYIYESEGKNSRQIYLHQHDSSISVVDVPNRDIYCFGEYLAYAFIQAKGDVGLKLNIINSDGKESVKHIKLADDFAKTHLSGSNEHAGSHPFLNPYKNSVSFLSELSESEKNKRADRGEPGTGIPPGMWREFDLESGNLILPPQGMECLESGHSRPNAGWLLTGEAPKGWSIFRAISTSTGGEDSAICLQKKGVEKSQVVVGNENSQFRGDMPLKAIESTDKNSLYVISGGGLGAQVERFDSRTSKVTSVKMFRWGWQMEGSEAFFLSYNRWLAVPRSGGMGFFMLDTRNSSVDEIATINTNPRGDFLVRLKNGFYAGSPGCELAFSHNRHGQDEDISLFAPWRNRPAEVARFFGGNGPEVEALAKATERWLIKLGHPKQSAEPEPADLPTVELEKEIPLWARDKNLKLALNVKRGKGLLKELVVRVNGVEQGRSEVTTSERAVHVVNLSEGQNWIEVVAKDEWGRMGRALRFRTILSESPDHITTRYVVSVGISNYADKSLNLNFAAKDATDIAEVLQMSGRTQSQTLVLTDSQAKKDLGDKIREFLRNAKETDEVIVFCAGHGVLDSRLDYIFASHDFKPNSPADTGVKLDDLVSSVTSCRALKRLILLDTCHAGLVGEKDEIMLNRLSSNRTGAIRAIRNRGLSIVPAAGLNSNGQRRFIEELFQLPGFFRGVNIIGASGGAEFAQESERLKNGVFTASIIEALSDRKADYNQDGRVRVAELRMYLAQRVVQLTQGAQRPSVVAAEPDQDFDIIKSAYWRPNENLGETKSTPAVYAGLKEFLSGHIGNLSSNDADKVMESYAEKVSYCYEKGVVGKDKVKTCISSLIRDYPQREYKDVSVQKVDETPDGSLKIFYSFSYLYSGKRSASGRANVVLTVKKFNSGWKITGFDEKIIRK